MAKMRSVYMGDEDYDVCMRAAGRGGFSGWAGRILVRESLLTAAEAVGPIGRACRTWGGACQCGGARATCWSSLAGSYICAACAARVNEVAPGTALSRELSPAARRVELAREIRRLAEALAALEAAAAEEDLLEGWRQEGAPAGGTQAVQAIK